MRKIRLLELALQLDIRMIIDTPNEQTPKQKDYDRKLRSGKFKQKWMQRKSIKTNIHFGNILDADPNRRFEKKPMNLNYKVSNKLLDSLVTLRFTGK